MNAFSNEQLIRLAESEIFRKPGGSDDPLFKLVTAEIEIRIKGKNKFEDDFIISKADLITWASKPASVGGLGLNSEFVKDKIRYL